MNTRSLKFRLIAWYAGLLSGVFILLGGLMYFGLENYLEGNLLESQFRRARQIADTLVAEIQKTGESYVVEQVKVRFAPEINDRYIRITRPDQSVLYTSGMPVDHSFDPTQLPALPPFQKAQSSSRLNLPADKRLLVAALKSTALNGGNFLVEAGAPLTPIESALGRLQLLLLASLLVVVIVAVGGGYFLVGRALKPVEQITRKAEQITHHNLSDRLPLSKTGDELEHLSISLNHMITRLDEAFQNSKRFVADASHELRTPLTILRGELEPIAQNEGLDPDLRETIGSLLEEVEQLSNIVEGLLALSRLDSGEAQSEWLPLDLAALVALTADQMDLLAQDKGISVERDCGQAVMIEGDRTRLKQVVVNLLDNAIKYTPDGGAIKLKVAAVNGHAVLEVTDNGIGIAVDAQPHLFERFFRTDKARSRNLGGVGLGLSIVKSICTAHGARIDVESTPGRGSHFQVIFPLARGTQDRN